MSNNKIKLNLGCGVFYKPGYINIDYFDSSIADLIADASYLPFISNSIDVIEAYHLIEHFDLINCKYVLSEWFRVLKPDGKLIIETPDLEKSFKKFRSLDGETKKRSLQWIYGIDIPGMHHKLGFTFELLSEILRETGFETIEKKVPSTHKYEPGLRVECKKPMDYLQHQFFSEFRGEIKQKLEINKSDVLSSLENYCINQIKDIFLKRFENNKKETINKIISTSALSNPRISLIFCMKCIEFNFFTKDDLKNYLDLIKYLIEIEFHKKLISLWRNSKKNIGSNHISYLDFSNRLENKISKVLDSSNYDGFSYISNLEPENVTIFNFYTVQFLAMVSSNKALKEFSKNNFKQATKLFLDSIRLFSDNPFLYWNLAKLSIIAKKEEGTIEDYYMKCLLQMKDRQLLKLLREEFNFFKNKNIDRISLEPVGVNI